MRRLAGAGKHPGSYAPAPVSLQSLPDPHFPEWEPDLARHMIAARHFCFLNLDGPRTAEINWSPPELPLLWRYHLNYFDYLNVNLCDCSEGGRRADDELLGEAMSIALDWCRQNATGRETGWEPYPLSLRIVNWLKFLAGNALRLDGVATDDVGRLLQSLRVQTLALERRLENDILGNHLLKNAKALMFAGAMLDAPESKRWRAKGAALLRRELAEQVLDDGGHFERSPMYHCAVLEDLLDLARLVRARGPAGREAGVIDACAARMADFLRRILHPDGEIPLFNDSAFQVARSPRELLAMAGVPAASPPWDAGRIDVLPDTGYAVLREPQTESCLVFDCGPLGPDYQPGHGHCDLLSYELSLHGERVVTDTGVSTYERCAERHYERSTAAHNTVRVDGEEQAEIWASFRVGRRPRVVRMESGMEGPLRYVAGRHDGYRHRGVVHSRAIACAPAGCWVIIDHVWGSGTHRIESFIHFHPAVRVTQIGGGGQAVDGGGERLAPCFTVEFGAHRYALMTLGGGRFELHDGWYAPEFGVRQSRRVVRWVWEGRLPTGFAYALAPEGTAPPVVVMRESGKVVAVNGVRLGLRPGT